MEWTNFQKAHTVAHDDLGNYYESITTFIKAYIKLYT